jgi:hypothetical protein
MSRKSQYPLKEAKISTKEGKKITVAMKVQVKMMMEFLLKVKPMRLKVVIQLNQKQ